MGSGHPEAPLRSTSLTLTVWWILYTQTSFIHPLKHVGAASWSRAPPHVLVTPTWSGPARRDLAQPDVIWSSPTWSGPARRDLVQPDVIGPASPTFSTWCLLDLTWVDKWGWAVRQSGGEQPNWELLKLTYLWFFKYWTSLKVNFAFLVLFLIFYGA